MNTTTMERATYEGYVLWERATEQQEEIQKRGDEWAARERIL